MPQRSPRRILVIDDDLDVLRIVCVVLESLGHFEVEACSRARGALEAALRFDPDMILLDVMMPDMDGPAVLKALRDEPRTQAIPVVFMTARIMPNESNHYASLGVAGIIAKPFKNRVLIERLHEIWRESADRNVSVSGLDR